MKRAHIRHTIPALALTAAMAVPAGSALAASATHSYAGPSEQMGRWGALRVTITVKNKKITGVSASVSDHTARSSFIVSNAIPALKQETLQAQGASINTVSGATDVSNAYIESLQGAIAKARQAKALK
ncbi:MAG: FMN-binding protein [Chloroflexi bacterium]|nr:FMN-binding protein [Chloroflexota bacterium]